MKRIVKERLEQQKSDFQRRGTSNSIVDFKMLFTSFDHIGVHPLRGPSSPWNACRGVADGG